MWDEGVGAWEGVVVKVGIGSRHTVRDGVCSVREGLGGTPPRAHPRNSVTHAPIRPNFSAWVSSSRSSLTRMATGNAALQCRWALAATV